MDEQPTLPADVRVFLPPVVQSYLAHQVTQIALLREQIVALHVQISKLQLQCADAAERKSPHSGNSLRPPSSDPPDAPPRPKRPPTGRKRGGQLGHTGYTRIQFREEDLTTIVPHHTQQCPASSFPLADDVPVEGDPQRIQVWEIPAIRPTVTDHRASAVRCPHCHVLVPTPNLPTSAFGARLTAVGALLHGRFRLKASGGY